MTDRAPALARKWAARRLAGLRWEGAVDDVLLVVSELVTNAVRHAYRAEGRVGVCLEAGSDGAVRLRVTDPSPVCPDDTGGSGPAEALPVEEPVSGRGLPIVAALAESLTWNPAAQRRQNGVRPAPARTRRARARAEGHGMTTVDTHVPYVTGWSGERLLPARTVVGPDGVAYADHALDRAARDDDGRLWEPRTGARTGRPQHTDLHPQRQRHAMERLLCAVCARPADRDPRLGMLWLLPLLDSPPNGRWDGILTSIPPLCADDAELASRRCPQLRAGHVRLRVREAERVGVRGVLHPRPGEPGPPDTVALVLDDSPDLPFVVACQLVRELRRCTVIPPLPRHRTPEEKHPHTRTNSTAGTQPPPLDTGRPDHPRRTACTL